MIFSRVANASPLIFLTRVGLLDVLGLIPSRFSTISRPVGVRGR